MKRSTIPYTLEDVMSKGSKLSAVLLALLLFSALIYIGCSNDEEPLQPPKTGKVVIESTPEGAAIWVDGDNTDKVTPDTLEFSDTDSHTVVLVLEGYEDYSAMFAATLGETKTVSATMAALVGKIAIESTPSGAAIWLDGTNTMKITPDTLEFADTDSHTVVLTLEGYEDYTTMVAATLGDTKTVNATLSAIQVAKLAVESTPAGADIYVDGASTARTTPDTLEFDVSGNHDILLTLQGYEDYTTNVDVVLGETVTVSATLSAVELTLTINVSGSGTVTKDPYKATYSYGETVIFTANPEQGWYFDGFSEDPDESAVERDLADTVTMITDYETTAYFGQLFTVTGTIEIFGGQDLVSPFALIDTSQSLQIVILESLGWQADAQTGEFRIDYIISERDELTGGIITGWDDVDGDYTIEQEEPLGYWDFTADGNWDNLDRVDLVAGDSIGGAQVILYLEPPASSGKAKSIPETSVRVK
jgi:hypothetical protein